MKRHFDYKNTSEACLKKKGLGNVKGPISCVGIKVLTNKQFLGAHREIFRYSSEPAHPFEVCEVSEYS